MLIDLQSLWERNFRLNQALGSTENSYLIVGADSKRAFDFTIVGGVYVLTGSTINSPVFRYLAANSTAYVLTGLPQNLLVSRLLPMAGGTYTLSGSTVTLRGNWVIQSSLGSYIISGQDVTLTGGTPVEVDHLLAIMGMGG